MRFLAATVLMAALAVAPVSSAQAVRWYAGPTYAWFDASEGARLGLNVGVSFQRFDEHTTLRADVRYVQRGDGCCPQHRSVPRSGIPALRLIQGGERLGGHRRAVLVSVLLVLCAPENGPLLEVDVAPPQLPDGTDAVPGLVSEHERDAEPPVLPAGRL